MRALMRRVACLKSSIYSQARKLTCFVFFPRIFEEKRNCSQSTGIQVKLPVNCLQLSRLYYSDKNVYLDQSIVGIFQQNTGTIKRGFIVTQIAIKNIQCRAGVRPAL